MQFGRVDTINALVHANLNLPADRQITIDVLKASNKNHPTQVFVACAKWDRPDWVGKIYPKGTKAADFLSHYVKYFNSIELNATFYRIFDKDTIEKCHDIATSNFKFCPKFPELISHKARLKNAEQLTL